MMVTYTEARTALRGRVTIHQVTRVKYVRPGKGELPVLELVVRDRKESRTYRCWFDGREEVLVQEDEPARRLQEAPFVMEEP